MGFMDKVKAAAGVGTAKLEVDIKQRPGKRGEEIIALLRIVPGKSQQKLNYLKVAFYWEGLWAITNADGNQIRVNGRGTTFEGNVPGSEGLTLEPGKPLEFPFQMKVPSDAPLSTGELKHKFWSRADIADVADPEFSTDLQITG